MRIIMTQLIAIGAGIAVLTVLEQNANWLWQPQGSGCLARQPERAKVKINLVLGCALAEATCYLDFVIALLIILLLK